MEDFLTGEELEKLYYDGKLDLTTLPIEDLIVLSDYLGETDLNQQQLTLLEKCLDQIGTFDDYKVDSDASVKEKTWNDVLLKFDQNNSSIQHKKPSKAKKIWVSLIAATISVVGISTVVCSANGINLFSFIFNKNMGVVSNSDVSMENIVDTTYTDLNTLLDEHSEVNIPQYLVDNCTFDSATCHLDSTKKEYSIFLDNNGNMIKFKQTLYFGEGSLPSINYEVDDDIVEQYSSNNFDYYIYSNNDKLIAIWGVDDTRYFVTGNFSVDELERVIDSIC